MKLFEQNLYLQITNVKITLTNKYNIVLSKNRCIKDMF